MLRQRVISSLAILPLLLTAIWLGKLWFSLFIGVAALLGLWEFYRLAARKGWQPPLICGVLCTVLLIASAHHGGFDVPLLLMVIAIIALAWVIARSLFSRTSSKTVFISWIWTLGGALYLGGLLGFWILVRRSFGWEWALLPILATFAVDTSAYFVGRSWGRRSLAPRISPKKTWEGALGGLIGGVVVVIILAFAFGLIGKSTVGMDSGAPIELEYLIVLGFLIGLIAQLGDLAESAVKRIVGTKEAGNLIPGHGGILDRLDSIVFTGVLVYYYLIWAM